MPVGLDLVPHEPTAITMIDYQKLVAETWFESHAYRKLRVVLFAPVVKTEKDFPDGWYIRSPFVWMPSRDQLTQLGTDWKQIRDIVAAGNADGLSSKEPRDGGQGVLLMAKTKGTGTRRGRSDERRYTVGAVEYRAKSRAFYLRKSFVSTLLDENVRYQAPRVSQRTP